MPVHTVEIDSALPFAQHLRAGRVREVRLQESDTFPNNADCPLLVYEQILALPASDPGAMLIQLLAATKWGNAWRTGVMHVHHYHSTAHEVIGCAAGSARLQLGGPAGVTVDVRAGDGLVIPAGVAHKNLGASRDFTVVGAYPPGQRYDMCYGRAGERDAALARIAALSRPDTDPFFGPAGPLPRLWP